MLFEKGGFALIVNYLFDIERLIKINVIWDKYYLKNYKELTHLIGDLYNRYINDLA